MFNQIKENLDVLFYILGLIVSLGLLGFVVFNVVSNS